MWFEPQEVKQRQKRDFKIVDLSEVPLYRVKRLDDLEDGKMLKKPPLPSYYSDRTFNDELWSQEWYLVYLTMWQWHVFVVQL